MTDVVVAAYARTPFGRFGGALRAARAPDLGAAVIDVVLDRAAFPSADVDGVYAGVGMIGAGTLTPARQAVMLSGLPETTPSLAVDRACCSGMSAVGLGWKDIRLGEAQALLCGGFEALSATPRFLPRLQAARPGAIEMDDPLLLRAPVVDRQIAVYTGEESLRHGVTREMQDGWALQSHQRYFAAQARGFFDSELAPVDGVDTKNRPIRLTEDESPRPDSDPEALARLKPIYGSLTVTAGNAPGLSDGAAMLLVMSGEAARRRELVPRATILGYAQVAAGPTSGTTTPALAIRKLLVSHGLTPDAVDLYEINEAYAATPLVSTLVLADGASAAADRLRRRTNVHGGAVAIGHPLGASGARLVMTLVAALSERGGGIGVAAICGGFGQGDALLVRVDR
ncbi:thiolase family protein [Sphingomonas sp. YL-JM2C]